MLHTGYLFKMGNGPINYDWGQRYFVLDEDNMKLSYFTTENDRKAKGHIELKNAIITNIMPIKGRNYSFCIKLNVGKGKEYNLSADTQSSALEWIGMIKQCISKPTQAMNRNTSLDKVGQNLLQDSEFERVDTESRFPNTKDFYRKVKDRMTKGRGSKKKNRKTEHVKRLPLDLAVSASMPALPTVNVPENGKQFENLTVADFGDILSLSDAFKKQLEETESFLNNDNLFQLVKYENFNRITVYKKRKPYSFVKKNLKAWLIYLLVVFVIQYVFGCGWIYYISLLGLVYLGMKKPLIEFNNIPYVYRASSVADYSPKYIFEYLKLHYRKEVKHCANRLIKNCVETSSNEELHLTNYTFRFEPTFDDVFGMFKKPSQAHAKQYWCIDENETRYLLAQIEEIGSNGKTTYEEGFALLKVRNQPDKCLIYFFTNIGCPGGFIYENIHPENILLQNIQENIEYVDEIDELEETDLVDIKTIARNVVMSGVKNKIDNEPNTIRAGESKTDEDIEIVLDNRFANGYNPVGSSMFKKKATYQENPKNLKLFSGVRMGISERFVGYFRMEAGLLWCHNQEELASQKGIVLDLIRKAGEKVMKGEGVVSISLPVRIFEPRSALERCGDLWSTGTKYLTLAGQTSDPIERFKFVMCFMVSSMYMVSQQRKPFNPILGETYQGYWPDGTKIYIEHISHHPPISSFLVEHIDGLYTYEGYYEYTAKLTNLGNSVRGRQVGMNRIHFTDGSTIEYQYPFLKINGLIMGKRTIQWEGSILFRDEKNNIQCELAFTKEGIFGLQKGLTYDQMEGDIIVDDQVVCEVKGSWLSELKFNEKKYWELDSSDIILPNRAEPCLPSDCRYREDSLALADNDLDLAQEEKERLEVLQRKDKKLRVEAKKKRLG